MNLRILLLVAIFPFTSSVEVLVERGGQESYDRIIWDGDCSKINGNFLKLDEENMCVCQKRISMHGVRSEFHGTLYPNSNGFVECSYFYREREVYGKLDIETEPENQNIEIKEIVLLL